jgi:hypothetical protein
LKVELCHSKGEEQAKGNELEEGALFVTSAIHQDQLEPNTERRKAVCEVEKHFVER